MTLPENWRGVPKECQKDWNKAANSFFLDGYSLKECPCCHEGMLRVYWYASAADNWLSFDGKKRRRAGGWMWCPACHAYEHWSGVAPDWWPRAEPPVPGDILYHSPYKLDERWADVLLWMEQNR